jgi:hypothetical protein
MTDERDNTPYQEYGYACPYGLHQEHHIKPGQQIALIPVENKSPL